MRGLGLTVQVVIFAGVLAGLALVLREVLQGWDDWVVFGVAALGAVGMALALYRSEYPPRSLKRRFGRSSGRDAPTARRAGGTRR